MQTQKRVQSKIGRLLFHRMGIIAVLIIAQIILYAMGLLVLRGSRYHDMVEGLLLVLAVLAAMWIVGNKSNPGSKIGWLIIVLGLMPLGSVAYLLLGGN
ncbi:MAG: PLDc N-terminal domain-containing protein, partial [Oscillospiraceae bacterium]|nr:PLDc N-terminal domain-containing protein [Oscillospiraceae bacterium]